METTTHNGSDATSLTERLGISVTPSTIVTSRLTSEGAESRNTQGEVSTISEQMSKVFSSATGQHVLPEHLHQTFVPSSPQEEVTSYADASGPDVSQYVTGTDVSAEVGRDETVRNMATSVWGSHSSSVGTERLLAWTSRFPGEVSTHKTFSWEPRSSLPGEDSVARISGFAGEVSTVKTFSRPQTEVNIVKTFSRPHTEVSTVKTFSRPHIDFSSLKTFSHPHTEISTSLPDLYTQSSGSPPSDAVSSENPLSFIESERLYSTLPQQRLTQEKTEMLFSTQRPNTTHEEADILYSTLPQENVTHAESEILNSTTESYNIIYEKTETLYSIVPQHNITHEESDRLYSSLPQYNLTLKDSEIYSPPQNHTTQQELDTVDLVTGGSTIVSTDSGHSSPSWSSLFNTLFSTEGGHSELPTADPFSDTTTTTFVSSTTWSDPTNTTNTTNISITTTQDVTNKTGDLTSSGLWNGVANVTGDVMDVATSSLWDAMVDSQDVANVTEDATTPGLWDMEAQDVANVTENVDVATSGLWDVVVEGMDVDETSGVLALKVTSLAILALGGVLGNALVIWSVVRQRHLHRPPFYYLLSLSLTDLSRAAFCLPLVAMTLLQGSVWRHGDSACDLFAFANAFFVLSSGVSLLDVAADRHLSLLYSRSYRRRAGGALNLVVVLLGWSLAFLVAFPPVLGVGGYAFEPSEGQCTLRHRSFRHDNDTLGFLLVFTGLALLTLFLYSRVFLALRAHRKMRPLEHEPARSATWTFVGPGANGQAFINWVNGFGGITTGPGANLARNPPRPNLARVVNLRVARNQHVTRLFFLMTLTFHLLWLPYQVLSYWRVFGPEGHVRSGFATSAAWLSYGQVLVCPLVYFAARGPSRRRPSRADVSPHDKQEVLLESVHRKK